MIKYEIYFCQKIKESVWLRLHTFKKEREGNILTNELPNELMNEQLKI
jgi:hypothetical protein